MVVLANGQTATRPGGQRGKSSKLWRGVRARTPAEATEAARKLPGPPRRGRPRDRTRERARETEQEKPSKLPSRLFERAPSERAEIARNFSAPPSPLRILARPACSGARRIRFEVLFRLLGIYIYFSVEIGSAVKNGTRGRKNRIREQRFGSARLRFRIRGGSRARSG